VLLRLAGAAARHGGDPRSAAPGGTPTYGSSGHSGGGCLALPPPDMRCHPLHATHTALRSAWWSPKATCAPPCGRARCASWARFQATCRRSGAHSR
jgi:hypothetical protein